MYLAACLPAVKGLDRPFLSGQQVNVAAKNEGRTKRLLRRSIQTLKQNARRRLYVSNC